MPERDGTTPRGNRKVKDTVFRAMFRQAEVHNTMQLFTEEFMERAMRKTAYRYRRPDILFA